MSPANLALRALTVVYCSEEQSQACDVAPTNTLSIDTNTAQTHYFYISKLILLPRESRNLVY